VHYLVDYNDIVQVVVGVLACLEVGVAAPGFAVDDKFDLVLPGRQLEHDFIVSIAGA
jgi:hypothetical protein